MVRDVFHNSLKHGKLRDIHWEGMKWPARQLFHASTRCPYVDNLCQRLSRSANAEIGIQFPSKSMKHRENKFFQG